MQRVAQFCPKIRVQNCPIFVPTGRVIKYPKKCAPAGVPGPDFGPPRGVAQGGVSQGVSWGYRGYPRYRPPIAGCTTRPVMFTTCPYTHPSAPGGVPPWTPRVVSGGYARGIPPGPPVAPGTGGYPPDPPVRPVSLACGRPTRPTGASPRPLPRGAMWGSMVEGVGHQRLSRAAQKCAPIRSGGDPPWAIHRRGELANPEDQP